MVSQKEIQVKLPLAAPKSLAPLASKSKASLPPLNIGGGLQSPIASNLANPVESKLSQLPNIESDTHETEFQSSETNMPNQNTEVDEVRAMMGQMSMGELPTSMQTRSPGPTNRSKLQMNIENSSMLPAGSNYAAHQQS